MKFHPIRFGGFIFLTSKEKNVNEILKKKKKKHERNERKNLQPLTCAANDEEKKFAYLCSYVRWASYENFNIKWQ